MQKYVTQKTRHLGCSDSVSILDWLLAGCDDDLARDIWTNCCPEGYAPVKTGSTFDAVILPQLLGQEVHHRLEVALQCDTAAALVNEDVILLVRAGSGFSGPTVPACLELRCTGATVTLPNPDDLTSWIRRPMKAQAPGFLLIPGIVRDVLYEQHYTHIPGRPPSSHQGSRTWHLVYGTEYREKISEQC